MNDHQVLPYYVQVYWEEAWCMSWSECCGCAMAFYAAYQWHMMVQYCCDSGSTNKLFCKCFLPWQEANEVILNVWLYKMTLEGAWQNKSRYKCGSCSTCQESTNRCQTTQFIVACTSNIGDMCIHSKMTVQCKTQIFHRLFEGNLSITYSDRSR